MPPKAKARKPKKPVQQKQKQRQSQRVVVNINQAKARAKRRASKPRQAQQQVSVQPQQQIIMTGGSAPAPPLFFNPPPIQSSGGFNPPPPTPSLGAPLEVPVFAGEPVRAIGDEEVRVPVTSPITTITPVSVEEPPIIQQPPPAPAQPPVLISPTPSKSDRQFISKPSTVKSSVSSIASLFSDISKETGITSQTVADAIFKKKKTPPPPPNSVASQEPQILTLMNPNPSVGSSAFPSTASSVVSTQSGFNIPDDNSLSSATTGSTYYRDIYFNVPTDESSLDLSAIDRKLNPPKPKPEPKPLNRARKFIKDDMSVEGGPKSFETISTRSGFYNEPFKGAFTNKDIIVPPKEVVILKKPELKRSDPFDVFSSDSSFAGVSPMKKRPVVVSSDADVSERPAGRRMPPIKEKKSNYKTLGDLQATASSMGIPITRENGKNRTREELRLAIAGR